jgi:hypothetical protein
VLKINLKNLTNYDVPIPENAVFRINQAWTNSLNELQTLLNQHNKRDIFIDDEKRVTPYIK